MEHLLPPNLDWKTALILAAIFAMLIGGVVLAVVTEDGRWFALSAIAFILIYAG